MSKDSKYFEFVKKVFDARDYLGNHHYFSKDFKS